MPQHEKLQNDKSQPQYRGDIIVDVTSLLALSANIAENTANEDRNTPKKYLETLKFLANNDYRIIIPEITSYEAGNILASGKDVSSYLKNSPDKKSSNYPALRSFLKDASLPDNSIHKETPNIRIATNTGPEEIDGFLKKLTDLEKAQVHKTLKSTMAQDIISSQKQLNEKGNTHSKDAINSLIENKYKTENSTPVFVLTDDHDLLDKVKDSNVKTVSTSQFIYSLAQSGLGDKVGFPQGISALELEKDRRRQFKGIDAIPERIHDNEDKYVTTVKKLDITKSFAKLNAALDKQDDKPSPNIAETTSSNQLEKFEKKYSALKNNQQTR